MFAQAVSLWRNMVANGASLDYPSAAEMIQNSEAMSKAFLQACQQVGGGLCWSASGNSHAGLHDLSCCAMGVCVHTAWQAPPATTVQTVPCSSMPYVCLCVV